MNIKFPWATHHTIVPSTEQLYCLISIRILVSRKISSSSHRVQLSELRADVWYSLGSFRSTYMEEWPAVNSNFQYGVPSERKDREIQRMEGKEGRSNWIQKSSIGQIYWTK